MVRGDQHPLLPMKNKEIKIPASDRFLGSVRVIKSGRLLLLRRKPSVELGEWKINVTKFIKLQFSSRGSTLKIRDTLFSFINLFLDAAVYYNKTNLNFRGLVELAQNPSIKKIKQFSSQGLSRCMSSSNTKGSTLSFFLELQQFKKYKNKKFEVLDKNEAMIHAAAYRENLMKPEIVNRVSKRKIRDLAIRFLDAYNFEHHYVPSISIPKTGSTIDNSRASGGKFKNISDIVKDDIISGSLPPLLITPSSACIPLHPINSEHVADNRAEVVVLPGIFKNRIITKNHWEQEHLKGLQSDLLKYLKNFDTFTLGRSNLSLRNDVQYLYDNRERRGDIFCSGDYEAATDNFSSAVSKLILEVVLERCSMPDEVKLLAANSLTDFDISSEYFATFRQQKGQLMGSILSFAILCIYNFCAFAAIYEHAYEVRTPPNMFNEVFGKIVRINGDDILFTGSALFCKFWIRNVANFGMVINKEKSQCSSIYASFNSQYYYMANKTIHQVHNNYLVLYQNCARARSATLNWEVSRFIYLNTIDNVSYRCHRRIFSLPPIDPVHTCMIEEVALQKESLISSRLEIRAREILSL